MSGLLARCRHGLTVCLLLAFALHAGGAFPHTMANRVAEAARQLAMQKGADGQTTRAPATRPCQQIWAKCAPYLYPAAAGLDTPEPVVHPRPRGAPRLLALADPGFDGPPPRVRA
ncbi:MAG: hypothetical protein CMN87_20615 [Stappia sp.]|uniref:hypothetical protein n=1 Tax=Stappia sp. TaxID=1870903 RepID=UPI000C403CEE|nr:hypothetical protein [Stappia sp.]MAA97134.1 hypothetical protein [Stappia sp.]MBM22410.1 hypothetical protein [Stappia sp.]|tara:strand:+ start:1222 stop:1566 length:345 start_codon:yes stop_codon:yes gene_type:complete